MLPKVFNVDGSLLINLISKSSISEISGFLIANNLSIEKDNLTFILIKIELKKINYSNSAGTIILFLFKDISVPLIHKINLIKR